MANRYIAYGYEITDGKISVIDTEKDVIINVFGMYINGHGMPEISNRLNQAGISYNNDGRNWNKNMIKRMLENRKYLGENEYPQIIPQDTFDRAEKMRMAKSSKADTDQKEMNDFLRTTLVCGCCGQKLDKYKGSRRNECYANYRRCKNSDCTNPATSIRDSELKHIIAGITNALIRNPGQIKAENCNSVAEPETETGVNFAEELNNPRNEIKDIVEYITKAAELRFGQCTEQDYTAIDDKIKKELSIRAESDEVDLKLMRTIVKIIRLYPNKEAEIELVNGNKFTGGINHEKCRI